MARKSRRRRRRAAAPRRRRRRSNPGMPVVLVNPRGRRRRRRTKARARRRNPSRRLARRRSYRRNPSVKFSDALMGVGLGMLGGALGYGVHWGVSYMKTSMTVQTATFGGLGVAGSIGLAMLGAPTAAIGLAGATSALLVGRIYAQVALAKLDEKKATPAGTEAGAVYRLNPRAYHQAYDAGAVYRMQQEAGAVAAVRQRGAHSLMPYQPIAEGFKEAGASEYIPGPVRWYGPRSWAYNTEAGAVIKRYRSAHSS